MMFAKPLLTLVKAIVALGIFVSVLSIVVAQNDDSAETTRQAAEAAAWGDNVELEFEGDMMFIKSNGLPNHEILDVYQALSVIDNKTLYLVEPTEQHMRVPIPLHPQPAETPIPAATGLTGIAISGGLFYSPYEFDGVTVALDGNFEIDGIPFIDACSGHPNPFAVQYHYHGVPYCITDALDVEGKHSRLLGYIMDGYPVYGPQDEDGVTITKAELDECHGHFGVTPEYPDGVYHYHLIEETPYMPPCYMGQVEVATTPIELLTRGIDPAYPPPQIPLQALLGLPMGGDNDSDGE